LRSTDIDGDAADKIEPEVYARKRTPTTSSCHVEGISEQQSEQ
jgi:hypothetical protein